MSLALSGSKFQKHTYLYSIQDSSHIGEVRRFASSMAAELNFEETRLGRIGILINELGNNLLKYAVKGQILIRQVENGDNPGVEIISVDKGPGLNIDLAMIDGYSTGSTPGTGLGAIRRLSDEFDIYSESKGTILFSRVYANSAIRENKNFDIAAVSIPIHGETVCGDAWSVRTNADQIEMFMVDGLGHGPQANKAALEAVDVFETVGSQNPEKLIQAVHGRLKATRGGAIFTLHAHNSKIDFSGVGNIRAIVQTAGSTKTLISQNGTAGLQIRASRALAQEWDGHGYLILHSDGIQTRWVLTDYPGLYMKHPAIIAATIYRDHNRGTDDSSILVAKRNL